MSENDYIINRLPSFPNTAGLDTTKKRRGRSKQHKLRKNSKTEVEFLEITESEEHGADSADGSGIDYCA